ncbi:phosphotransferase [Oceanobacillus sp. 143]|uniref:Aminoglycoside phosphotransferase family protein n=1 Tax=Oceanobacillus zhaokaii TaxID=2052660 RepID=A0A345PLF3_9BACI|nr:aminoglycoside phosphotransferase family protein [Oceanobacillus zhaokaii]AXI10833.1 aminoglycoside phosphotransferase family protein [Oceanobacillus zhaokaii]QGS69715.1 phosphotransferase [Oceanobacillus sp. 143]
MKITEQALAWVIQQVNQNATIESIEQLKGSTSSILHLIKLRLDADIIEVVLRQFTNQEWLQDEPDLAVHEASSLWMAVSAGLAAPEIIAYDTGDTCGVPLVLMSKLDGKVNLKPKQMQKWINELAKELARVHKTKIYDFPWRFFRYQNAETVIEVPSWSTVPDAWKTAIELLAEPQPTYNICFIHRDYHPANVLWKDESISGVVDWVNACIGPAGIDVGHCRWNLAMLYGVEAADMFLAAYQRYAGDSFIYNVYWDLCSLIDVLSDPIEIYSGWEAFGVTEITNKTMEARMDAYLLSLL